MLGAAQAAASSRRSCSVTIAASTATTSRYEPLDGRTDSGPAAGAAPCPYCLAPCPNSLAPCPIYIAPCSNRRKKLIHILFFFVFSLFRQLMNCILYNACGFVPMFSSSAHKIVPRSCFVRTLDWCPNFWRSHTKLYLNFGRSRTKLEFWAFTR